MNGRPVQLLVDKHDVASFDCGVNSLNRWLIEQAARAQAADTARTCVWAEPSTNRVVAYFSIAATQLGRSVVGNAMAGGYSTMPAYVLARLALDKSLRGQGLGRELLLDALTTITGAAASAAGRLVVVDAIDDTAAAFYRHHDFKPLRDNPHRLVMKLSTARQTLGLMTMELSTSPETGLVSMLWHPPGGTPTPIVTSLSELGEIADRIREEVERTQAKGLSKVDIDFMSIVQETLGRDPSVTD